MKRRTKIHGTEAKQTLRTPSPTRPVDLTKGEVSNPEETIRPQPRTDAVKSKVIARLKRFHPMD